MRALRAAADDARALAEGRAPGHRRSRRARRAAATPSSRSASPRARPTTSRPRGSSSPPAATPTRSARPRSRSSPGRRRWARSPSTRGRCAATTSTTPTSCASTSTRSRAPTSPTPCASPPRRATLLDDLGYAGFPKTSGGRGVHIYVRIEPRWTFTDVRHAAIAFGRELERRLPGEVTTKWWKEERGERIFVDYNQNARDRTIASAYSVRPKPGAPVSAPVTWDELRRGRSPRTSRVATMPARFAEVGDLPRRRSTTSPTRSQPLLDMYEARRGGATCPIRPTTRRCRASRSASSRRATRDRQARRLRRLRQLLRARACVTGADGGGTTGPMSPSGASSRSTITGAWSLGPLPLRAWRSTHAALTRSATGSPASTRSIRMPRSWWNMPAR